VLIMHDSHAGVFQIRRCPVRVAYHGYPSPIRPARQAGLLAFCRGEHQPEGPFAQQIAQRQPLSISTFTFRAARTRQPELKAPARHGDSATTKGNLCNVLGDNRTGATSKCQRDCHRHRAASQCVTPLKTALNSGDPSVRARGCVRVSNLRVVKNGGYRIHWSSCAR